MIDKDIKYKDVPQLVKPRKDGKRPGYRGDAAAASGAAGHGGNTGGGTASGRGDGPARGGSGLSNREQYSARRTVTPKTQEVNIGPVGNVQRDTELERQRQRTIARDKRIKDVEELIDRPTFGFTDAAKYNLLSPKSIGSGIISLATGVPFLGSILTNMGPFNNRQFYDEKVVPAGKTDLSYDDYMDARLSGEIDAYGNPIGNIGGDGGSIPSQAQLIQQAAIVNPLANTTAPQENLQGGVAQLYAQYMRNLGYNV